MDDSLFQTRASTHALGCSAPEFVTQAFATADTFNREMQEMVTEYCWGGVWGRTALSDQQRSLNNLCILASLNRVARVQDSTSAGASQRLHARRTARHADPDHGVRRRAGGRRGVPPRARGARGRRHRCRRPRQADANRMRREPAMTSASSDSGTWARRWRPTSPPPDPTSWASTRPARRLACPDGVHAAGVDRRCRPPVRHRVDQRARRRRDVGVADEIVGVDRSARRDS